MRLGQLAHGEVILRFDNRRPEITVDLLQRSGKVLRPDVVEAREIPFDRPIARPTLHDVVSVNLYTPSKLHIIEAEELGVQLDTTVLTCDIGRAAASTCSWKPRSIRPPSDSSLARPCAS